MISDVERAHGSLEQEVAEKYRQQGFEVIVEPEKKDLPFDLGNYRPDVIAVKTNSASYVIEIKDSIDNTPIDRYRDIAENVSEHPGWSFVLVTGQDIPAFSGQEAEAEVLTWSQMFERFAQAKRLLELGEPEPAFLLLWVIFEAVLRRHAMQVSIPIDRLPTTSLIKQLYSQGELSIEQFDAATALQDLRNQTVHGFQTTDLKQPAVQLEKLVNELLSDWFAVER